MLHAQVDEALAVLQDMASRGAERSPVAYGALVAAAERGGRPALALQLFDDMLRALLKPSAATFAAALAACAQSEHVLATAVWIRELLQMRQRVAVVTLVLQLVAKCCAHTLMRWQPLLLLHSGGAGLPVRHSSACCSAAVWPFPAHAVQHLGGSWTLWLSLRCW